MKTKFYFLLMLLMPLLLVQCQEEEPEPPQIEEETEEDYEFKLRLLNENLEEATEFEEGKNIIFSFLMTNNTDKKTNHVFE